MFSCYDRRLWVIRILKQRSRNIVVGVGLFVMEYCSIVCEHRGKAVSGTRRSTKLIELLFEL
jgi:hypothetical protein